jgi:hypothetical protein
MYAVNRRFFRSASILVMKEDACFEGFSVFLYLSLTVLIRLITYFHFVGKKFTHFKSMSSNKAACVICVLKCVGGMLICRIDLQAVGNWIALIPGKVQDASFVNMVMNLQTSSKEGFFLTN